jgi:hypothetical protein
LKEKSDEELAARHFFAAMNLPAADSVYAAGGPAHGPLGKYQVDVHTRPWRVHRWIEKSAGAPPIVPTDGGPYMLSCAIVDSAPFIAG